jgi:uncharacterized SAM-binding protein YcdF (DUF218 family)
VSESAVVLLGCRWLGDGAPSPAARRRIDRAAAAVLVPVDRAEAEMAGSRPGLIVVSGGRRWGRTVEAVAMADALVARGVARDRIVLELLSLSTVENARFSAELLRAAAVRRAAIVTCDWHVQRALRSFEAFGIDAVAWPATSPAVERWARLRRDALERCSELLDAHVRRAAAPSMLRGWT